MRLALEDLLLDLNQQFYEQQAEAFALSRTAPWPGFTLIDQWLPHGSPDLLDVGCGDGRLGRRLKASGRISGHVGIDQSEAMLSRAAALRQGRYLRRNLALPGALAGIGTFRAMTCVATLQHIPGRAARLRLLREMAAHLAGDGRLVLVNWQFLKSARQRRKIAPWAEVGLRAGDVDADDYLLRWSRGGQGLRYVALINGDETRALAAAAGLEVLDQACSDGREGHLNLYTLLARPVTGGA